MEKIVIVEDELIVARDIRKTLERAGYKITGVARTAEKALQLVHETAPSLVLVDIFLKGDLTGIDLATRLNEEGIPFIYISANSNQPVLEAAKLTNPYGFIVKPFREKDLLVTIDIARYRYENNKKMNSLSPAPGEAMRGKESARAPTAIHSHHISPWEGLIGKSAGMLQVSRLIQLVAPFDTSVLLLGESGTGKEVVANCIYRQSLRSGRPFIKVNCAAIPASLMEAELFGYEKGAFTGAAYRKAGKFEQAAGGTVLLDEVGEMPIEMQAKLLRVLQEKEIQRIGGHASIKADIRVIAATSRHLEKEVAEGRFRLDLYYRLNVFPIELPALRQRKEDIPLLTHYFFEQYARKTGRVIPAIDKIVLQQLAQYSWPGNVRELQHLVERTLLLADSDTISSIVLPEYATAVINGADNESTPIGDEAEKAGILAALRQCRFKIAGKGGAAELLHLPPATLYNRIKKLGIKIAYTS